MSLSKKIPHLYLLLHSRSIVESGDVIDVVANGLLRHRGSAQSQCRANLFWRVVVGQVVDELIHVLVHHVHAFRPQGVAAM